MAIQEITVQDLKRKFVAEGDIYLRRGRKIFSMGDRFPLNLAETLEEVGVTSVFLVPDEDLDRFMYLAANQKISLTSPVLQKVGKLSQSLYNQNGELILKAGGTWTREMADRLARQEGAEIFLRRPDEKIAQDQKSADQLQSMIQSLPPAPEPKVSPSQNSSAQEMMDTLKSDFDPLDKTMFSAAALDSLAVRGDLAGEPDDGKALRDNLVSRDFRDMRDAQVKVRLQDEHRVWIRDIKQLMQAIADKRVTDTRRLSEMCRHMITALIEDKDLLLNANFLDSGPIEDFVFAHSVNSTIVSINIATAMGYSLQQVYQLSFGAFLHDIGMLRVPPEILYKKGKLTDLERSEIFKHPMHSLDMLQSLTNIPPITPLIAYQSHERGDKSGYPRRKPMPTISKMARIVSVADVFCAMTAPRPYREAHGAYAAMEYMTREAVQSRLDRDVLKAFMSINSLYPVGSWVVLDNQNIGKVVSANADQYDRPALRVFYEGTNRLNEPVAMNLAEAEHQGRRVVKTFDGSRLKIETMEGF